MFRPSWRRWLPWWSGASRGPRRKQPGGKQFRPAVHVLEDRTMLSAFQWVNPGSGLFNDANNWRDSANVSGVPGLNDPNDTAAILINGVTVTSSENHTIRSLTSPQATLQVTTGT